VEDGTVFVLPFQFEKELGPVTLIAQVGREFRADDDAWLYGVSISRALSPSVEIGVELAGGGSSKLGRTQLTANVGLAFDLSERTSLLLSVGRELHNHDEPRASFIGFLGLQWRL